MSPDGWIGYLQTGPFLDHLAVIINFQSPVHIASSCLLLMKNLFVFDEISMNSAECLCNCCHIMGMGSESKAEDSKSTRI